MTTKLVLDNEPDEIVSEVTRNHEGDVEAISNTDVFQEQAHPWDYRKPTGCTFCGLGNPTNLEWGYVRPSPAEPVIAIEFVLGRRV